MGQGKALTDVGNRVAGLQLQFLERVFVFAVVVELDDGHVSLSSQTHENLRREIGDFTKHFISKRKTKKPDLFPETLTGDLLLVGLAQLHLPHAAVVVDAREDLQRHRLVLVEERRRRRLLRVAARQLAHRRRHVRLVYTTMSW